MRIDPTTIVPISEGRTRTTAPATRTPAEGASVVRLGEEAAAAAAASPLEPEVAARISRVRELLSAGEYEVDLDQLAERILDDDVARGGGR